MKRLVAVAALACTLAACGDAAEESDDPVPTAAATVALESWAGTYEFEAGGRKTTAVLSAGGTYADTVDGEVVEGGHWEVSADGKVCFDPTGDETPVTCFAAGDMAEDGTMVVTPEEGDPLTVRKVG